MEFCDTMVKIFEAMEANNVSLIDNERFLNFASITPNPTTMPDKPPLASAPLPDTVKDAFLTENGARAFATLNELRRALRILFDYRAARGLELFAEY